jgi:hypothetical protein
MITARPSVSMTARNGPAALLPGEIRAAEPPGDRPLTASVRDEEHLLPAAVEADGPALGIDEADAIQRLKPHQLLPA